MSKLGQQMFRRAVIEMGGEVLPGFNDARCADFLFRPKSLIVEMKILDEQARNEYATRMEALANTWIRRGLLAIGGREAMDVPKLPPECQQEWADVLESSAGNLIRHCNRQIRATKQRLGLPNAKGVFLIGNEDNLLHASPEDYLTLVLRRLARAKEAAQEPGFFHVQAAIYFSLDIPADPEVLPFWAAGQVDREDGGVLAFLAQLRNGWFASLSAARLHETQG
jgi:hypothetical protein